MMDRWSRPIHDCRWGGHGGIDESAGMISQPYPLYIKRSDVVKTWRATCDGSRATVILSYDLKNRLKQAAHENDVNMTIVVQAAIESYLVDNGY